MGTTDSVVDALGPPLPDEVAAGISVPASPEDAFRNAEDARLIERVVQADDQEAFAMLVRVHHRMLYGWLLRAAGQESLAQDVYQDTWLRAYEHLSRFERGRPFAPWLLRIARNRLLDEKRKKTTISISSAPGESEAPEMLALASPDDSPETLAWRRQLTSALNVAFQSLPLEQAEACRLHFVEGLSGQQIADQLGLPLGTVKGRLRLGARKLCEALGPLREDAGGASFSDPRLRETPPRLPRSSAPSVEVHPAGTDP